MSNEAMSTDPQPPNPQPQPQQQAQPDDELVRLAQIDIPAEQRRLKQIQDPNTSQLMQEMSGTVLDILKDIARNQVEIRDWAYAGLNALTEHVEALEQRVDLVEDYGAETVLLPEDAEVLAKVAVGCKFIATQLLNGPFPLNEPDEEGKQKLAELVAFTEQAEKIIADNTLGDDDDDDSTDDGTDGTQPTGN